MKELLLNFLKEINYFDVDVKNCKEPSVALKPGEQPLTELNEFEKTCFAVMQMKDLEHENEHNEFGRSFNDIPDKLKAKHIKIHTCMSLAKTFLMQSLQNRISHKDAPNGFELRKGYKVVGYKEGHPFFRGMDGVQVIEIRM